MKQDFPALESKAWPQQAPFWKESIRENAAMPSALLPRDLLIAAKKQVTHAELQLEVAREETRRLERLKERADWLADRPDLLSFVPLIEDLPRRQARQKEVQDELDRARTLRLDKRTKSCSFKVPQDLAANIAFCKLLLEASDSHPSEASLHPLLHAPSLDGTLKAELTKLINARKRVKYEADFEAYYLGPKDTH